MSARVPPVHTHMGDSEWMILCVGDCHWQVIRSCASVRPRSNGRLQLKIGSRLLHLHAKLAAVGPVTLEAPLGAIEVPEVLDASSAATAERYAIGANDDCSVCMHGAVCLRRR